MAEASTIRFGEFTLLIGNGNSPEVFEDYCGINSRGFERTIQMNDTNVPDCTDPDLLSWLQRDPVSASAQMPIAGVVAKESIQKFEDFFGEGGESRNVRIELADTLAWEGRARLQAFAITGARGQRVTFTANLVSDGAMLQAAT